MYWRITSLPQVEPQSTGCSSITDSNGSGSITPVQHGNRHDQEVSPEGLFMQMSQPDLLVVAGVKVHGEVALQQHNRIHRLAIWSSKTCSVHGQAGAV